jgi:two-component system OmpR family response regulator
LHRGDLVQQAAGVSESPEAMSQSLLIVEDEASIREPLARYFETNHFRVKSAPNAAEARTLLAAHAFDLVISDIMMPGEDGLSLCRHIRSNGNVPVILLTARSEELDRILGLEVGADDYVVKPFSPRELLARVKAVLRRANSLPPRQAAPDTTRYAFGDWVLKTGERELVGADGLTVPLSSGEYNLLLALVERPKLVLTRDQLLSKPIRDRRATSRRSGAVDTPSRRRCGACEIPDPQPVRPDCAGDGGRPARRQRRQLHHPDG